MNLQEAYKIVYEDMMNSGCCLFKGIYDAKHGSDSFMFGIETVLEYIASNVSEECHENFDNMFMNNMSKCESECNNDDTSGG